MPKSQLKITEPIFNAYNTLGQAQHDIEEIYYRALEIADTAMSWVPESIKIDLRKDLRELQEEFTNATSEKRKVSAWLRKEIGILLNEEWVLKK